MDCSEAYVDALSRLRWRHFVVRAEQLASAKHCGRILVYYHIYVYIYIYMQEEKNRIELVE